MKAPSTLESLAIRTGGRLLARGGPGASLAVLIFHRVLATKDDLLPYEPDAAEFSALMSLASRCFNVLPLTEAVERLRHGTLPSRALCITFDDGYANNLHIAQPILAAHRVPATVFVAPGYLDGGRMFNDTVIESIRRAPADLDLSNEGLGRFELSDASSRVKAYVEIIGKLKYLDPAQRSHRAERIAERVGAPLPNDLMMTSREVQQLHGLGIEIGAHTVTHPILKSVATATARDEIVRSKQVLEEMIAQPVRSFAYPNGAPQKDYGPEHVRMVSEAGFDLALSTSWGTARAGSDVFQLPRVAPWDRSPLRYGARILRSYGERARLTT